MRTVKVYSLCRDQSVSVTSTIYIVQLHYIHCETCFSFTLGILQLLYSANYIEGGLGSAPIALPYASYHSVYYAGWLLGELNSSSETNHLTSRLYFSHATAAAATSSSVAAVASWVDSCFFSDSLDFSVVIPRAAS